MTSARLRLYCINTFIGVTLAVMALDALPQSPPALRLKLQPALARLGISQGPWNLFSPEPDQVNRRLRAEIIYRDGEERAWTTPTWRELTVGQVFVSHRRRAWWDRMISPDVNAAWEPSCRYLARTCRPECPAADHQARVRLLHYEARVPAAEIRPWQSFRKPLPFDDGWILTTESLE